MSGNTKVEYFTLTDDARKLLWGLIHARKMDILGKSLPYQFHHGELELIDELEDLFYSKELW